MAAAAGWRLPGLTLGTGSQPCADELAVPVISMEDLISNPAADSILLLGDDAATTTSCKDSTKRGCAGDPSCAYLCEPLLRNGSIFE